MESEERFPNKVGGDFHPYGWISIILDSHSFLLENIWLTMYLLLIYTPQISPPYKCVGKKLNVSLCEIERKYNS